MSAGWLAVGWWLAGWLAVGWLAGVGLENREMDGGEE
jgi:hypothetical protein